MEESLKLLLDLLDVKLKKEKQYDFFLCKLVWVHKLVSGNKIWFITEEDYQKLQKLGIKAITIE